jgi:acetate kinase
MRALSFKARSCIDHVAVLTVMLAAAALGADWAAGGPRISTPDSRVSAWIIPTDEERMIWREPAAPRPA